MASRLGRRTAALTLAVGLVSAACSSDSTSQSASSSELGCGEGAVINDRPLRIAATVAPITNIVSNITAASDAEVIGVVPEGTDSHTYEPAPSTAATLESADIVFLNGLSLEEPTRELASGNLRSGSEICELGTAVLAPDDYIFDVSFPESEGNPNPHLWTNPPMALLYAELVRDVLIGRNPTQADLYQQNYNLFALRVGELDTALRRASETIPAGRRQLLTYHDAYAYFADEYGWTILGAVEPSSFNEPTPREVADLIRQVRDLDVKVIFGSEVFPSPVLDQIASDTGAAYVDDLRDDDLPGRPGDIDHSWLALMKFNYVTIIEAFGGDATALVEVDASNIVADEATYPQ
jgi:ABC-type Zn uptake system ZnuABC Zn-binding protein ZnuA